MSPKRASIAGILAINPAISDSGKEISDEQIAPIARLARGMVSRKLHRSCACCADWAITPSRIKSDACSNRVSIACSAPVPFERPRCSRTDQLGGEDHGTGAEQAIKTL